MLNSCPDQLSATPGSPDALYLPKLHSHFAEFLCVGSLQPECPRTQPPVADSGTVVPCRSLSCAPRVVRRSTLDARSVERSFRQALRHRMHPSVHCLGPVCLVSGCFPGYPRSRVSGASVARRAASTLSPSPSTRAVPSNGGGSSPSPPRPGAVGSLFCSPPRSLGVAPAGTRVGFIPRPESLCLSVRGSLLLALGP